MFSNKLLLLIALIIYSTSALAAEADIWTIDGKAHSVIFDEKLQTLISSSCAKSACGAREMAQKAQVLKVDRSKEESSRNPGSLYCQQLKGVVVIGKNERGSENAFCQAADKTMVNLSSLGSKK